MGCSPFTEEFEKEIKRSEDKTIVMVDRGDCTFVHKTRNIQSSGGNMALIINHQQNFDSIFALKDDGTGHDINITTILIPEEDGNTIKEFIQKNKEYKKLVKNIMLSIINTYVESSESVRFTVFFNPTDFKVYKILNDIRGIDENFFLSQKVLFNPIYTFDSNIEDEQFKNTLISRERCICHNRYCEDYEVFEGRKGSEIILEAIRQKSLYLISSAKGNKKIFFDYLNNFYHHCLMNSDFNFQCSENILKNFDSKYSDKILEYTIKSFRPESQIKKDNQTPLHVYDQLVEKCNTNVYLEEHAYFLNKNMKKGLPLILINDEVFFGSWKSEELFKSLCSALEKSSQPKSCEIILKKSEDANKKQKNQGGIFLFVLSVAILGIIIALLIYIICKKYFSLKYFNQKFSTELEKSIGDKHYLHLQLNIPELDIKNTSDTEIKLNPEAEIESEDANKK